MGLGDRVGDREAQTDPSGGPGARGIGSGKAVEDALQGRRGHAAALVLDLDPDLPAAVDTRPQLDHRVSR